MGKSKADKPAQKGNLVDNGELSPCSANAAEKQRPAHWFKPGQSGNPAGKPKGARHKLTTDFVKALADDFEKHGVAAISTVREEDPGKYLDVIAKLVPKDIDVNVNASDAFVQMWEHVAAGTFNAMAEDLEAVSQAQERPN